MSKKRVTKGRKVSKPKAYRLRAETGRFRVTGNEAELLVRRVEEALANLPSGALSERQAEDIHRNISVATDESAKPKDRKMAWDTVLKICGAIQSHR
jgi:hypothetical protein